MEAHTGALEAYPEDAKEQHRAPGTYLVALTATLKLWRLIPGDEEVVLEVYLKYVAEKARSRAVETSLLPWRFFLKT
jgi:hypothetical protein